MWDIPQEGVDFYLVQRCASWYSSDYYYSKSTGDVIYLGTLRYMKNPDQIILCCICSSHGENEKC